MISKQAFSVRADALDPEIRGETVPVGENRRLANARAEFGEARTFLSGFRRAFSPRP
jgi:hypothetical protein